jgi:hypothetical protein
VPADLIKLSEQVGNDFDVIIDDGSHRPEHQMTAMTFLFPLLNNEGTYIIEDVSEPMSIIPFFPNKRFLVYESQGTKWFDGHYDKLLIARNLYFS